MKLRRHDGFLQHFNIVSVRVKTSQLLEIVVELNLLENLGD
jgi:hypothetical protein